jgi:uncharacterized protein (DUF2461 family)
MSEQQEQSRTCSSYAKSRAKKDVMQMNDVKEIISFLTDLSENNNRQRYTEAKKMAEALCAELIEGIRGLDPYVGTLSPQGCLFRIFRDTRFAKDKSPYRPGFGMYSSHHLQ